MMRSTENGWPYDNVKIEDLSNQEVKWFMDRAVRFKLYKWAEMFEKELHRKSKHNL